MSARVIGEAAARLLLGSRNLRANAGAAALQTCDMQKKYQYKGATCIDYPLEIAAAKLASNPGVRPEAAAQPAKSRKRLTSSKKEL
jgi:hypothetical protein